MNQGNSIDDYRQIEILGRGTYGAVHSCYKKSDLIQRKLAMKVIYKEKNGKDHKEKEILEYMKNCKLKHENVVLIEKIFEDEKFIYVIMEYCHTDLAKELKQRKQNNKPPYSEQEALKIIRQVALGYRECCRNQIIHRDLKPANILIKDGIYKIADFGEAKVAKDPNMFMEQTNVGTRVYQSPQLLLGDETNKVEATNKVDIYSLGIIFYELLTLDYPFKLSNEGLINFCYQIKQTPFDVKKKLPNLNSDLAELINKMLKFEEKDRIGWPEFFSHPQINCPILTKVINLQDSAQTLKTIPSKPKVFKQDVQQTQNNKDLSSLFKNKLREKKNENIYTDFFKNIPDSNDIEVLRQYFQKNKLQVIQYFPYNFKLSYSKDYLIVLVGILNLIDGKEVGELSEHELYLRQQLKHFNSGQ